MGLEGTSRKIMNGNNYWNTGTKPSKHKIDVKIENLWIIVGSLTGVFG